VITSEIGISKLAITFRYSRYTFRSPQVSDDEDWPAPSPIHQESGPQSENKGCETSDPRKPAHLERVCV